jgi:hypothetical protein
MNGAWGSTGMKHTEEAKRKISIKAVERYKKYGSKIKGIKRPEQKERMLNEGNPNWYGDKVGIAGVHLYIKRRYKKPSSCENCGKETENIDLACKGEYTRNIKDYEWICRKCHMVKDGRLNKLHESSHKIKRKRNEYGQFC